MQFFLYGCRVSEFFMCSGTVPFAVVAGIVVSLAGTVGQQLELSGPACDYVECAGSL